MFLFKEDASKVRGGASDGRGGGGLLQNAVDVYVRVVHFVCKGERGSIATTYSKYLRVGHFLQKHSVIVGQCAL